jgi:hypothetical protein
MGSKLHIASNGFKAVLFATWRQKSQNSQFYERSMWFQLSPVSGSKPPIFQYLQGSGKTIPPIYIVQYLQDMLAIFNIHTCRDQKPYIRRSLTLKRPYPSKRTGTGSAASLQPVRSSFNVGSSRAAAHESPLGSREDPT